MKSAELTPDDQLEDAYKQIVSLSYMQAKKWARDKVVFIYKRRDSVWTVQRGRVKNFCKKPKKGLQNRFRVL